MTRSGRPGPLALGRCRYPGARRGRDASARPISSLLRQDYPGAFRVILVDDQSRDGTARGGARRGGRARRGRPAHRPAGRPATGRLDREAVGPKSRSRGGGDGGAATGLPAPHRRRYRATRRMRCAGLSRMREAGGYVLTSLMAKLRCESFAERVLVPAFIFFFQMLYPVRLGERSATRDRRRRPAAACWCARMRCAQAGGIAAIRDALIDDCALAQEAQGARSDLARPDRARAQHPRLSGWSTTSAAWWRARPMRSCNYSPLLLAGTVARHGAHLSVAAAAGAVRHRAGRRSSGSLPGWLMAMSFQPISALLPPVAAVGPGAAGYCRRSTWCSRSIPPISMRAGAAAVEGARPGQRVRNCDDCDADANCVRARATGTRISRSRRG